MSWPGTCSRGAGRGRGCRTGKVWPSVLGRESQVLWSPNSAANEVTHWCITGCPGEGRQEASKDPEEVARGLQPAVRVDWP